jgi:malic enzyme
LRVPARAFRATGCSRSWGDEEDPSPGPTRWSSTHEDTPTLTPWVRQVISGVELLRNARYNKGMSFSDDEREKMHMQGLLPPAKFNQHTQVKRVMRNVRALQSPIQQHLHLVGLLERNERLFHKTLVDHVEELLPVVYTPTVGQVCKTFSELFTRPRGLYITARDKGMIHRIMKNWPEKRVKLIVVTDGERVMGLGDLGVQGMGVAVSKTMLYTAIGGVDPADILAVCLDVGTNNESLLNDPLYIGTKQRRVTGDAYDELLDEFVEAAKRRFGERCVVQFEDFSNANGKRLLERYATQAAVFNDDIHGVAATTLAGVIASGKKTRLAVHEHTYLIAGAGGTGHGIGEILAEYVARDTQTTVAEARRRIWMVDSGGLVTRHRAEIEEDLALHKLPYAHDGMPECGTVLEAVRAVKPTALIGVRRHKHSLRVGALAGPEGDAFEGYREDSAGGVAGVAEMSMRSVEERGKGGDKKGGKSDGRVQSGPPRLFTADVLRAMGENTKNPLIFALSRPEGIAECLAQDAYDATDGRCVFASGCPVEPFVDKTTGKQIAPRPSTSAYVFPGFALGLTLAEANRVRSPMFLAAAEAVADLVTDEDLERGAVYPRVARLREVAAHVAAKVASKCFEMDGVATGSSPGKNKQSHERLVALAKKSMYDPAYRCYM